MALTRCPVCHAHVSLVAGEGVPVLNRHRDHRFERELVRSNCPAAGSTMAEAQRMKERR